MAELFATEAITLPCASDFTTLPSGKVRTVKFPS